MQSADSRTDSANTGTIWPADARTDIYQEPDVGTDTRTAHSQSVANTIAIE